MLVFSSIFMLSEYAIQQHAAVAQDFEIVTAAHRTTMMVLLPRSTAKLGHILIGFGHKISLD